MRQKFGWQRLSQLAGCGCLAIPVQLLASGLLVGGIPAVAEAAEAGVAAPAAPESKPSQPITGTAPGAAADSVDPGTGSGDGLGLVRLAKDYDLWIDRKRKLVVVDGYVCLRAGQLEMFACPRGSKEHESLVAVNCRPRFVHAALLAVGAVPGSPMKWDPYEPATGTPIEIKILWVDEQGERRTARAQDWIKDAAGKPMSHSWVFAGSRFWTDPETKQEYYSADGGDFICVSNFPSAMLDLPIKSSASNAELTFQACTEQIPPLKTKVRLVLIPQLDKPAGKASGASAEPASPTLKP